MELNSTGKLAQLYRFTYDKEPSNNLCGFFWKELLAVALLPITWISFPYQADGFVDRVLGSVLTWGVFGGLGMALAGIYTYPADSLRIVGFVVLILGGIAAFVVLIALLAWTPWQGPPHHQVCA